jgi:hypothetical protein
MKTLRKLFFKPKERVFATIYIPDEYKNGIVIKKAHYTEKECKILHWGISYEVLNGSVVYYTVAIVLLNDGSVCEVHPTNIKYEL